MTRRLWVASELYYPEDTSTGYFLTRIAEGLAATYQVTVLTARPGYAQRDVQFASREVRNGVAIQRLPSIRASKDRLLNRAVGSALFSLAAFAIALARLRRGDLVLVVTNPPTLPFVILVAARLRGARPVLLVHDVYPDILAATKLISRASLAFRLLDRLFTALLRRFTLIVVLGRDMRDTIAAKLGTRADRVVIIPNWADLDLVTPSDRDANALRASLDCTDKFIVQVSGNFGRTHDLDAILAAAADLRDDDSVRVLLVGQGGRLATIDGALAERGLTNVTVLPRQPRDALSTMLTCSNLTVISYVDDMLGLSVPSRMYNIMAAGVPIAALADQRSELAQVIVEAGAGWTLGLGEPLADLVRRLAANPSDARARGDAGRLEAERNYGFASVIAAWQQALATVVLPAVAD